MTSRGAGPSIRALLSSSTAIACDPARSDFSLVTTSETAKRDRQSWEPRSDPNAVVAGMSNRQTESPAFSQELFRYLAFVPKRRLENLFVTEGPAQDFSDYIKSRRRSDVPGEGRAAVVLQRPWCTSKARISTMMSP